MISRNEPLDSTVSECDKKVDQDKYRRDNFNVHNNDWLLHLSDTSTMRHEPEAFTIITDLCQLVDLYTHSNRPADRAKTLDLILTPFLLSHSNITSFPLGSLDHCPNSFSSLFLLILVLNPRRIVWIHDYRLGWFSWLSGLLSLGRLLLCILCFSMFLISLKLFFKFSIFASYTFPNSANYSPLDALMTFVTVSSLVQSNT